MPLRVLCLLTTSAILVSYGSPLPPSVSSSAPLDIGYENLFVTQNVSIHKCIKGPSLPSYMTGFFIISSLGQFEMKEQRLRGLFDAFGKMHRFHWTSNDTMCYTTKMMDTEFYNESIRLGKVAPSNLFYETDPPRGYSGMKNIAGPIDNVFVNTYRLGAKPNTIYRAITDAQSGLEFDPSSLHMVSNITWKDRLDKPGPPLVYMSGSAHPQRDGAAWNETGCLYNVRPSATMMGGLFPKVEMYKVCPDKPSFREVIGSYHPKKMPYFHSWGLTERYAVLPHMPFTIDVLPMMMGGTIVDSFKDVANKDNTTTIMVMPLDGSAAMEFEAPGSIYFTHSINAYETENSVVYDMCSFSENPFVQASELAFYLNATMRNAMPLGLRGTVIRLEMYTSGAKKGSISVNQISEQNTATDFATKNMDFNKKHYCFYYAVEWFHGTGVGASTYGSMAVVKQNVCTGQRDYWYKASHYPSEPRFVDDFSSNIEDHGRLIFTVMNGLTRQSSMVVLDASTMTDVAIYELESTIGFTTHGEFYPDAK